MVEIELNIQHYLCDLIYLRNPPMQFLISPVQPNYQLNVYTQIMRTRSLSHACFIYLFLSQSYQICIDYRKVETKLPRPGSAR
jgi:hypothetical protein